MSEAPGEPVAALSSTPVSLVPEDSHKVALANRKMIRYAILLF